MKMKNIILFTFVVVYPLFWVLLFAHSGTTQIDSPSSETETISTPAGSSSVNASAVH